VSTPRRTRVRSWKGPAPVVGDQLRSQRGRYLILRVELNPEGKPSAFVIVRVKPGEGDGLEHRTPVGLGSRQSSPSSLR